MRFSAAEAGRQHSTPARLEITSNVYQKFGILLLSHILREQFQCPLRLLRVIIRVFIIYLFISITFGLASPSPLSVLLFASMPEPFEKANTRFDVSSSPKFRGQSFTLLSAKYGRERHSMKIRTAEFSTIGSESTGEGGRTQLQPNSEALSIQSSFVPVFRCRPGRERNFLLPNRFSQTVLCTGILGRMCANALVYIFRRGSSLNRPQIEFFCATSQALVNKLKGFNLTAEREFPLL